MKRWLTAVAWVCASALFAGGMTEQTAPVPDSALHAKLEYWSSYNANENQGVILQEAADDFMKQNPGVKITMTFNGRDNRTLATSRSSPTTTSSPPSSMCWGSKDRKPASLLSAPASPDCSKDRNSGNQTARWSSTTSMVR